MLEAMRPFDKVVEKVEDVGMRPPVGDARLPHLGVLEHLLPELLHRLKLTVDEVDAVGDLGVAQAGLLAEVGDDALGVGRVQRPVAQLDPPDATLQVLKLTLS